MSEIDRLLLPFTGPTSFLRVPSADLNELDADIAVLGVPSDEGSPWIPGARLAPKAIREMSVRSLGWGTETQRRGQGYFDINERRHYLAKELGHDRVVDCGDVEVVFTLPEVTHGNVTRDVKLILAADAMPVVIGGDHAITFPVVRAYEPPINVIHFDAHLDYRPFVHGITLSNGSPMRLIGELPQVGHILQVGIRSLRLSESDLHDSLAKGNHVVTVREMRDSDHDSVFESISVADPVYVSIDIDVLDMPIVPGCSSGEIGGFSYEELVGALTYVASRFDVRGFDIVEVNPLLDVPARNTCLLAAQLAQEFMARITDGPAWRRRHELTPAGRDGSAKPASPEDTGYSNDA